MGAGQVLHEYGDIKPLTSCVTFLHLNTNQVYAIFNNDSRK